MTGENIESTTENNRKIIGPYLAPSVLVTLVGIVTNLLSLSYFVTQRKNSNRLSATEDINKKLFILLNTFDILVCISLTGLLLSVFVYGTLSHQDGIGEMFLGIFILANQCTGYITCQLSVIRTISIIWPQYNLNTKLMIAASVCFGSVMVTLCVMFSIYDDDNMKVSIIAQFLIVILMFIVVILANVVCIIKLTSLQLASWKREATITMGILSVLYCTLNVGFLVVFGFHTFMCPTEEDLFCTHPVFETICLYVLLPLNSACNPIVYFVRNPEMRRYLTNRGRRIRGPSTIRDTEMEVDMESKEGQHVTTTVETKGNDFVQDGDDN